MIAGMTLATVNVNAQDKKDAPVKKEATAACSKSADAASAAKCDKKMDASASTAGKDAGSACQKTADKSGACCKSKSGATASEAKVTKTVN